MLLNSILPVNGITSHRYKTGHSYQHAKRDAYFTGGDWCVSTFLDNAVYILRIRVSLNFKCLLVCYVVYMVNCIINNLSRYMCYIVHIDQHFHL